MQHHRHYGFAWYCSRDKALITQTTVDHGRSEGGRVLSDWIDLALREDADGIAAAGGLFLFHDFRSLAGYDTETRVPMNERIKQRKPGYARRTIMVVRPTPLWGMAMRVTDLTLALLGIPRVSVTGDMQRAAAELTGSAVDNNAPAWLSTRPSKGNV
ncbi:MAG TPA: hypothetical protein VFZ61_15955 [Polyangiales bacterium]